MRFGTRNVAGSLKTVAVSQRMIIHFSVEMGMHTMFWLENLKGRHHLDDLGVGGKIMLKWLGK
jgi:hypothetical protein